MKRALVASLLGIAASAMTVASSYGQGQIIFDNYLSFPYYEVQYNTTGDLPLGVSPGQGAGTTIAVQLYFGLGVHADLSTMSDTGVQLFIASTLSPTSNNGADGPSTGWFHGPTYAIPGYTGVGQVTFGILAWETAGAFGGATWNESQVRNLTPYLWQEDDTTIANGTDPIQAFGFMPSTVNLNLVPEPSTFALAGLGAAALLIFRRRK